MKKIILALVLLTACAAAYGQYIPEGTAKRHGSKISINGQKLTKEQQLVLLSDIDGQDYTRQWDKGRITRGWGMGLTIGGGTVALVGAGGTMVMVIATALGVVIHSVGISDFAMACGDVLHQEPVRMAVHEFPPIE